ncbi:MAG: LPS assembly protein LptD [Gloeobacteraceae cyanobacterium ES-bin-144]|nr:LPS assembly protein LptD [Verrucomicrobiales bacterium]
MLRIEPLMLSFLLLMPLGAQESQVLPDSGPAPAVDTITPVPAPEIPIGAMGAMQPVMPKELQIDNQGGTIEGSTETGVRFGGPVKIEGDNGLQIFADTAVLDLKEKSATLTGHVSVYQGNMMQRGERAVYYYERKFLDASNLRASLDPLLLEAGKFTAEQHGKSQILVGTDASITTHDVEDPSYWVRAKKTTIFPGEKIVFNDLRLYAGDVPVFWLPYLSQPLDAELGYHFVPGARSTWGAFLLNTYGIMLGGETDPDTGFKKDEWLLSRYHLDLRSQRGVGLGFDLADTRIKNADEISGLKLYYTHDLDPENTTTGITRGYVSPDRYSAELKHRIELKLPDQADWRLDANLSWLSDRYYLQDFQPDVYRTNPEPDNTIGIFRRDDNSLLSLYTRIRINDFYRSDTRLPEAAFDMARAPLFGSPILHEGNASLGFIGEKAADFSANSVIKPLTGLTSSDPAALRLLGELDGHDRLLAEQMLALPLNDPKRKAIETQLLDPSYGRFNTYQNVSLPMMLGGFLSLTPEAGIGYSRYFSVAGPEGDSNRTQFHVGAESSVKFSKNLGPYQNHDWGIKGMLHVLQPYANWSLVSTDAINAGDPMVDRLTPTTRPRPLDPIRFTATDEIQSWNVLRLGTRNRLITKRDGQSFEWLYVDSYVDAFIEAPQEQQAFSNFYNDVRWQPIPWMNFNVETQVPLSQSETSFSEFNSNLRFLVTDRFDFSLGYRWLSGHPVLLDSSLFNLTTYTRISEEWGFGTRHILEVDDGTLQQQQYMFFHNLGSWVVGMGGSARDNRFSKEYSLLFSITLKDLPSVSLPFGFGVE